MENIVITKDFLNKTIKFGGDSLVGKICKRIELLQLQKNILPEVKLGLIKDLIKEHIYEELRNIGYSLEYFSKGLLSSKKYNEEVLFHKEPPSNSDKKE